MSPFIERRYESLGNTFFVEALDGMTEGAGYPLRRRHSFSHLSLAHEIIALKKNDSFRVGKSVGSSRHSNCIAAQVSKPFHPGMGSLVRSSQTHRTAPAGTLSMDPSRAETQDSTCAPNDGTTRVPPSTANKNDLIKSLSTMGKFALARAATLAKGAPRSSLERFPQLQ